MIRKNKFHKKGFGIFLYKRCAFLFFLFFVSFFNSQIYFSEGITVHGSEYIYDRTSQDVAQNVAEAEKEMLAGNVSSKVLEAEKTIKAHKAEPKTLITKKEKIEKSIQKKIDDQKRKKIDEVLLPRGKTSSDYFTKAKNSESSILLDNQILLLSVCIDFYISVFLVVISTSLFCVSSGAAVGCDSSTIYSVRPPPTFS